MPGPDSRDPHIMPPRLAPRLRLAVAVTAVRCSARHHFPIAHLLPELYRRDFLLPCPYRFPGHARERCPHWLHVEPVGLSVVRITDVTRDQALAWKGCGLPPEDIARRVIEDWQALRRRPA